MKPIFSKIAIYFINLYQRNGGGSGLLNVDCNFEPTCSEYAKQAIEKKGLMSAIPIIIRRLRRCNDPDKVDRELDPFVEDNNV